MTVFWTIFAGTFVFVLGQLVQRLVLEPIQEQRKNVAKIAQALTVHRNAYLFRDRYNVDEGAKQKIDLTSAEIKKLAAELRAGYSLIPFNAVFAFLRLVPDDKTVRLAALYLIRWATFASDEATVHAIQNLAHVLKIKFIASEEQEFKDIMMEAAKKPATQADE